MAEYSAHNLDDDPWRAQLGQVAAFGTDRSRSSRWKTDACWPSSRVPADLASGVQLDYGFPAGTLADWTTSDDGSESIQTIDGGVSFLVSDIEMANGQFGGIVEIVGPTTEDDFVGVVFGLQTEVQTNLPDSFYLLTWKRHGTR